MAFQTPTFEEQAHFCVAHFKALFPEDDISATSFNLLWLLTIAAAVTDNHAHIDATKNDLLPDTAEGDELERWAKIRGVTKKGATGARKAKALRVTGVAGTNVPVDAELVHDATSLRFKTTSTGNVDAILLYVDIDIAALDTGAQTRLPAGESLRFTALPSPNLEESNELQLSLDEDGTDAESDGDLRLRVLSRFSSPPLGGAQEDYVQWALAQTGIAAAFCYPVRAGLGSVDLAALHAGSGSVRALSDPETADLQAKVDELRPVNVKAFRVLKVIPAEVDIEFTYVPNGEAQFAPDWDDAGPPTVGAWNAGTRKLTFAGGVRPPSIIPGDRLAVKDPAGTGTGKERVVESLDGADAVILEDDADGDVPAAGYSVYSGGPLVEPIRAAIQALVDSLGTANPDAKRYGAWEGNLRPSAIGRVATAVEGVLDGTVIAPAVTQAASDPAYPDDDEIGLLIAGRILVRKQA